MRSGNSKQLLRFIVAVLAGSIAVSSADAASARRKQPAPPEPEVELSGKAAIAVVAIEDQRISVYDGSGVALRARVSSGQIGYETPVGVFSILQKNAEHYSNLYDDASMPFMQRITWSGVAFHAGALPGYPASHGCVRLPYDFARKIFSLTKLGMRVVISRDDIAPADISHPLLLAPEPVPATAMAIPTAYDPENGGDESETLMQPDVGNWPARQKLLDALNADAREKAAKSRAATQRWQELTDEIKSHKKELSLIAQRDRIEKLVDKAKDRVTKAEKKLAVARTPRAQKQAQRDKEAAEKSLASIEAKAADARQAAAQAEESITKLREDIATAEKAKIMAESETIEARRKTLPISVFVSLKSQKLYVRQGNEPVFDTKIAIADPDKVIGTHIFTALDYANDGNDVHWNVVTISRRTAYDDDDWDDLGERRRNGKAAQSYAPPMTNVADAAAALERVTIPQDVRARISKYVWPGSSLIISDEELSKETGPGTDFILVASDEPAGALKKRKRETPPPSVYYDGDFYGDSYYYRPLNRYERRVPVRPKTLFDWW